MQEEVKKEEAVAKEVVNQKEVLPAQKQVMDEHEMPSNTDKLVAVTAQAGASLIVFLPVVIPLLIYLMGNKNNAFVMHYAKQGIWSQLAMCGISAIAWGMAFFFMMMGLNIMAGVIFFWGLVNFLFWQTYSMIGTYKAIKGEFYTYPCLDKI